MSRVLDLLPFILLPSCFFGFLAVGLMLLFSSRERISERYLELVFQFTGESIARGEKTSPREVVLFARMSGILLLGIALASGYGTFLFVSAR